MDGLAHPRLLVQRVDWRHNLGKIVGFLLAIRKLNASSKTVKPRIRVAKAIERYSHSIHDAQIQAAQLAIAVAGIEVIERTSRLERVQPARQDHEHLFVVVLVSGAVAG